MSGKHKDDYSEDYRLRRQEEYDASNTSKKKTRMKSRKSKKVKENKSKLDIVFKVIAFIYVILTIVFFISVVKMDLLPLMYIMIFTIAEVVFTIAMGIGLAKKHKTYKLNIFCLIIVLLISSIYVYVTNYANATTQFLGSVFTEVEETDEYYVVVKNNSNYSKIEDLKNKEIYLFQVEEDVKQEVGSKASATFKTTDNLTQIAKDLTNSKIEAILVSSSQYGILSDEIEKFKENTKIIYTATHKIVKTAEVEKEDTKYNVENGIFNLYISGIDTSGRINNVSRSDANILVTINTKTHEVLLTSIPRDYYVTLHSKKAKDKLTHSGIYGISETVTTVEDLLDIDINYYVRVNFTTVIKVVDTLGGIDVYSDYNFTAQGYNFKKGYNHVNGQKALAFSRERYSFSGGDNQRVKNQQHVIEAIINKVLDSNTILTKYTSILNSLEGSFQTNIDQKDISKLVKEQLQTMPSWKIKTNSLTGTGASNTTYSAGSQKLYVMIPNSESVQNAKKQIKSVMGE